MSSNVITKTIDNTSSLSNSVSYVLSDVSYASTNLTPTLTSLLETSSFQTTVLKPVMQSIINTTTFTNIAYTTIDVSNTIVENVSAIDASSSTAVVGMPYIYTADYAVGSVFYVPSDYSEKTMTGSQITLKNIPTDTTKTYSFTVLIYNSTYWVSSCWFNQVQAIDTSGNYILGTSTTYGQPFMNGGFNNQTIVNIDSILIQTFYVISIPTSAGVYSRYITSSISCNY